MIQKLLDYLSNNQDQFIDELKTWCAQPSVAAENRGMQEMAKIVETKLKNLGANTRRVSINDSYPFILAELGEGDTTLLIYDHYDVQPEDPVDLWKTAPFEPVIKNNKLFARGVADNKHNLLLRLQVIEVWQKILGDLPIKIKWLVEGEEEIGSPHLHELAEQEGNFWKDAKICLWETGWVDEEGRPMMSLGMKGLVYVELESSFNRRDLHSGYAAIVQSPVWRLINALSTLRDENGQVVIDGFYDNAKAPTKTELKLMQEQEFDPQKLLNTLGAERSIVDPSMKADFLYQLYFKGSCNIAGIWAGYIVPGGSKTVLPNKATAKLDLRLVVEQDKDDILQKLRNHLDKRGFPDIAVRDLNGEQPGKTPPDNKYIQLTLKVLEESYGKKPYVAASSYGTGPIYPIATQFKIPVVELGASYPGTRAHGPNEHIRLDDYAKAMRATAIFINTLGKRG